ncbi:MAG: hypothetical protein ACQGVK_05070 [Myxococcota bacterium]
MRGRPRRLAWAIVAAFALGPVLACATGPGDETPAPFDIRVVEEGPGGRRALTLLATDFYRRIANRRFNSIATYQDPSLREFFRTEQAWSDYYADLVQKLEEAYFEAVRPTRVQVVSIDFEERDVAELEGGSPETGEPDPLLATLEPQLTARIVVRFTGENGRPLRWWTTSIQRTDSWKRIEGRWWIVPGKL